LYNCTILFLIGQFSKKSNFLNSNFVTHFNTLLITETLLVDGATVWIRPLTTEKKISIDRVEKEFFFFGKKVMIFDVPQNIGDNWNLELNDGQIYVLFDDPYSKAKKSLFCKKFIHNY
jgi:hypothetical protein